MVIFRVRVVTGGDAQRSATKGSDFWAKLLNDSRFSHSSAHFGGGLQRVRTFFAFFGLGTKGSQFSTTNGMKQKR